MKRKIKVWICVFSFMIIAPSAIYFVAKPYLNEVNEENRSLAAKPELDFAAMQEYPAAFEAYYNDNLPFRSWLVKANSYLKLKLFHESASDQVVLGKEDWLFLDENDSIADYKGKNYFKKKELKEIKEKLLKVQKYCDEQNIQFVLYIAPNKETIYPEYMPDTIKVSEDKQYTRAEQLINYMKDSGINILYPKEELIAAKNLGNLYYPLDSHWNSMGAYIGAQALLKEFDVSMPKLDTLALLEDQAPWNDLAGMLNLKNVLDGGENKIPVGYTDNVFEPILNDNETVVSYKSNSEDQRKLFVVRDSFSIAMFEYLAPYFKEYYTPKTTAYHQEMLKEQNPDIYVYQVVERNLQTLLWNEM